MAKVAPSILSANFGSLKEDVQKIVNAGCEYLHFDVMDGNFVPNISFGAVVLKDINDFDILYDVHLMIADPIKYSKDFACAKCDLITFHYEAVSNVNETIDYIKSLGVKVGISIKPATDVNVLNDHLDKVDVVLVMSVEPGFGGQKFIDSSLEKIKYLKELRDLKGYHYLIEVDGGINKETSQMAVKCGADILVAGTYIFKSSDINETVKELKLL